MSAGATDPSASHRGDAQTRGILLVVLAGLIWSTGAVIVRGTTGLDAWEYLAWRSVGIILVMGVLHPAGLSGIAREVRRFGVPGWVASCALAVSSLAISYALKNTTVAMAIFLSSVAPLISMLILALVFRERTGLLAFGCAGLGLVGIVITLNGDLSGGRLIGNLAAFVSAAGFAVYSVCVVRDRSRDWSVAVWVHGWINLVICLVIMLTVGKGRVPFTPEVLLPILHGGLILACGLLLYNRASRSVTPFALLITTQTETVFSPLWALVVLGEVPAPATVIGGAVIILAVVLAGLVARKGLYR